MSLQQAAAELLPLVYSELRTLAGRQLAEQAPGQTLQPTALVHEAYLKLVGKAEERRWKDGAHFFAAAAQAMRHIGGLTLKEAAAVLDIAPRTADAQWAYARGWLLDRMTRGNEDVGN